MIIFRFRGEELTVKGMNDFVRRLEQFLLKNVPFMCKKTYTYGWEREYANEE